MTACVRLRLLVLTFVSFLFVSRAFALPTIDLGLQQESSLAGFEEEELDKRTTPCQAKWGDSNPSARCRTAYLNSIQDFCLFSPQYSAAVSDVEADVVSYCTKSGYGTRIIPPGTIHGAQWLKTKEYIQVVGVGDLTKINVKPGDPGGELDPYGAELLGNPHHGRVFTRAISGEFEQIREWHMFIGYNEFSFRCVVMERDSQYVNSYAHVAHDPPHRICYNNSPNNKKYCNNRYDEQGSEWVDPGKYPAGVFEACDADPGEAPGWYGSYHWEQGQGKTPPGHPPPKTYNCRHANGITGGKAVKIPQ